MPNPPPSPVESEASEKSYKFELRTDAIKHLISRYNLGGSYVIHSHWLLNSDITYENFSTEVGVEIHDIWFDVGVAYFFSTVQDNSWYLRGDIGVSSLFDFSFLFLYVELEAGYRLSFCRDKCFVDLGLGWRPYFPIRDGDGMVDRGNEPIVSVGLGYRF